MGFAKERNRELLSNGDRVLRKDRIELLEEIGFNWEVNRRIGQSKIKRDSGGLKQSYFIHTKMGKLSKGSGLTKNPTGKESRCLPMVLNTLVIMRMG